MRRLASLFLGAVLILSGTGLAGAAQADPSTTIVLRIDQQTATVNGSASTLDTAPVLRQAEGRTYVPVRFIGEQLGAYLLWNSEEKRVTYLTGDKKIELWIGRRSAEVNGRRVDLDAPPFVDDNSRTLVPVRFVSEQLGARVAWDGGTRTVTVTAPWVGRVVEMRNAAFTPAKLTVDPGTRVTWVNLDTLVHNVYGPGFSSPTLATGQAFSHTFARSGEYRYECTLHPGMEATVAVR